MGISRERKAASTAVCFDALCCCWRRTRERLWDIQSDFFHTSTQAATLLLSVFSTQQQKQLGLGCQEIQILFNAQCGHSLLMILGQKYCLLITTTLNLIVVCSILLQKLGFAIEVPLLLPLWISDAPPRGSVYYWSIFISGQKSSLSALLPPRGVSSRKTERVDKGCLDFFTIST